MKQTGVPYLPIVMSRTSLKLIAVMLMLSNHYAAFLVPFGPLQSFLVNIGYFTAPIMCYFLVEGYGYTRSKRSYASRLLVFALLSQYPYSQLFGTILNMLFSLFFCFLLLYVNERAGEDCLRIVLMGGLFLVSLFCDWSLLAPLMTLMFSLSGKDRRKLWLSFALAAALMAIEQQSLLSALPVLAAGFAALVIYNGKEGLRLKWFFYLFYPLHLLVLVCLVYYFPLAP